MKSSTLKRSNLSKEKMAVLEALSKYKQDTVFNESPNEYVRPAKEKELDVLWQNFKINQKSEKSPSVFLFTGFVAGIIVTLAFTLMFSFSVKNSPVNISAKTQSESVNLIPAGGTAAADTETYTVQNGDTIESIMIRFYGSYSPAKAEAIRAANNLSNINRLQIGQKLSIPME